MTTAVRMTQHFTTRRMKVIVEIKLLHGVESKALATALIRSIKDKDTPRAEREPLRWIAQRLFLVSIAADIEEAEEVDNESDT